MRELSYDMFMWECKFQGRMLSGEEWEQPKFSWRSASKFCAKLSVLGGLLCIAHAQKINKDQIGGHHGHDHNDDNCQHKGRSWVWLWRRIWRSNTRHPVSCGACFRNRNACTGLTAKLRGPIFFPTLRWAFSSTTPLSCLGQLWPWHLVFWQC